MWTVNFQMFKLVLEKAEESEINANIRWIIEKALLIMPKPLTVVDHNKLWKILKEMGIPDHLLRYQNTRSASWEICMQVRKQQLELDMEQQTGSK